MRIFQYRLLTVILIGVLTSSLCLGALVRVITSTAGQRHERTREAVAQQLAHFVDTAADRTNPAVSDPPAMSLVGLRGGYWGGQNVRAEAGARQLAELPPQWRMAVAEALITSASENRRVVIEKSLGGGMLLVAAQPAPPVGQAWAGYLVPLPHFWKFWRTIIILLSCANVLLVTTAIWSMVSFTRGAQALHRCLLGLATDLSTPIPHLGLPELKEVAAGIETLAAGLREARAEQERLSRELSQRERLAALGRVVAGVAHEVRNPLASIKLRLDLASAGTNLPPAIVDAVTHASAEISRLDRLVADLLLVAGRNLGPLKRASLGTLLRTRGEALAPWATARGVRILTQGDATAMIDVDSLGRAVDNLLRNAVEASRDGETVVATIDERPDALVVSVEDHGLGVPSSAQLFEPFFTTKPEGTGLGLAISRAIARAHGGEVTYCRKTPTADGGQAATTCFSLSLRGAQSPLLMPARLPATS